jgi:ribosomal protein S18 acetylase RimI-like enzyme
MLLRPAKLSDAVDIARIHVAAWQAAYTGIVPDTYLKTLNVERHAEIWRIRLEKAETELWLVDDGGVTVGWIAFGSPRAVNAEPNSAEIYAVYVAPACWSRGIGQKLLACAVQRFEKSGYASCHLWVLVNNVRSRHFYELAGFAAEPSSVTTLTVGTADLQEIRYIRQFGKPSVTLNKVE